MCIYTHRFTSVNRYIRATLQNPHTRKSNAIVIYESAATGTYGRNNRRVMTHHPHPQHRRVA
jgi:hypothetical protein